MNNYIVFDIGGSSIKWSIINLNGEFLENGKIAVPKTIDEFFQYIADKVNELKDKYQIKGAAISAPGAVDSVVGTIGGMSALPYIHGPNFKVILNQMTNLPIEIENDANCAALGECWRGAAMNANDSAFVVCGTGIGGAICKRKGFLEEVNKKLDEVMNNNYDATVRPLVKICEYGNNANKLGALYNFLQKQALI